MERNAPNGPWILHDGPPYANGDLHMGTFLNMVLKDMFVKIALLDGKYAKFVPGWDMHGLPIEYETLKHLGIKDFHADRSARAARHCKERALFWLDRQREHRVRMGNFGLFDRPYRTIDPSFEATIVNALADLAERQQIYKGLRSTFWCVHDETALAEAEIEYEQRVSPSIYVRFTATPEQAPTTSQRNERGVVRGARFVSHLDDDAVDASGERRDRGSPGCEVRSLQDRRRGSDRRRALAEQAFGERFAQATLLGRARGAQLDDLAVRHPFMDRDSVIVLADYVDLETGTGAVHTAPGHGADDFDTGMKYGLPILNPVDATGHFTAEAGPYAGMQIFEANATIVEDLERSGALWSAGEYEHSYPHCWRCHNPVIFRATAQWFLAMDQNLLRQRAIDAIDGVEYVPEWGRARQRQMIETHPEWCLSRQRTWGTPIPSLLCKSCGEAVLDRARRASGRKARFGEVGADAWWSDPVETYLPARFCLSALRRVGVRKREEHRRHLVRVGRDAPRRARSRRHAVASRPRSRRRRSVSRLVSQLAHHRPSRSRGAPRIAAS